MWRLLSPSDKEVTPVQTLQDPQITQMHTHTHRPRADALWKSY